MKDTDVFDGKKLSDILKSIHDNSINKRTDINGVIEKLVTLVTNLDDAVMLMPLVREFYDVGIKNDEQVVKVATIIQRLISADSYQNGAGEGVLLSDEEKQQLMKNADINTEVNDMESEQKKIDEEFTSVKRKLNVV